MSFAYLPNILSLTRVLLACVMFYCIYYAYWLTAAIVLWLSVFSDILDGFLARKFKNVSNLGGVIDHASDATFVTLSIAALTFYDYAPSALALIIPVAFLQYMLDSKALSGQPLRTNYLGRYNGIAYYVFSGFPVMQLSLELTLIPFAWFVWLGWALVLSTAISMIDRLTTLMSHRPVDE